MKRARGNPRREDAESILLADNLDHAFIGVVFGYDIACYDYDLVIDGYMADGMEHDDAVEFFSFNVMGTYAGPRTPVFLRRMTLKDLYEREGIADTSDRQKGVS